jgi:hypothetical protein
MLSVSESDVSIASGKLFASDKYVLQSGTPNAVLSLAPLKYVWCLPIEAKFFLYTRIYGR